jgi:hypothetical protein
VEKTDEAFVLWLEPDTDDGSALRGRVEHVRSSRRVPFASAEELLRFLEQRLRARAEKPGD